MAAFATHDPVFPWMGWYALLDRKPTLMGHATLANEQEGSAMLMTLNQLTGLPVVWQGSVVGQVDRGVMDK